VNHWREKASQLDAAKEELFNLKQETARNAKLATELETELQKARSHTAKSRQNLNVELGSGRYGCRIDSNGLLILKNAANFTD